MMKKLHLIKGFAVAILLCTQTFYAQTVEPETGTLEGGVTVGSGNGGTDNIVTGVRYDGGLRWVTNSVTIAETGLYDIEFVYLNNGGTAGATLSIDGGATFVDNFALPGGGTYGTYATATAERIELTAGTFTYKLVNPTGGGINFDKYIITPSPEIVTALPGTVEVETGTLDGGPTTGGGNGGTVVSGLYGASRSVTNSVSVATAGVYDFEFYYKSDSGNSTGVILTIDDPATNLFGGVFFTQGGSYATYLTASKTGVYLAAGSYAIKLINATGNGINIDKYIVTTNATGRSKYGSTISITDSNGVGNEVEIENYDIGGEGVSFSDTSVGNSNTVYTSPAIAYRADNIDVATGGTNYIIGNTTANEWMEYSIDVTDEGSYQLEVSLAAGSGSGASDYGQITAGLYNTSGVQLTELISNENSIKTANTGGWSTFATVSSVNFDLSSGTNQILRIKIGSGGTNIDKMKLVYQGVLGLSDLQNQEKVSVYPNPSANGVFNLSTDSAWSIYTILGVKVLSGQGGLVDLSSFTNGVYVLQTANGKNVKLINK